MSNSTEINLEALLKEARTQAESRRQKPGQPAPAASRLVWTDPARWTVTGYVQLVHREENMDRKIETLLGVFEERKHATGARHLVACKLDSTMNPKVEYVKGDHWITNYRALETKHRQPDSTIEVCEDILLDCGPGAPATVVSCQIVSGGIARVVLMADTRFESFTPRTILALPAGMDVLEGLTRDTKERIWEEVKKQLGMKDEDTAA